MATRVEVISDETIARDTCRQLVRSGRDFTCSRVEGGWRFEVKLEAVVIPPKQSKTLFEVLTGILPC